MHLPIKASYLTLRSKDVKNAYGWGGRTNKDGTARLHQGWDIAAAVGTPVCAIADSVVEFVRKVRTIINDKGELEEIGYGNEVCISLNFKNRTLYAQYAHLKSYSVVKGQYLAEGEILGYVGQTGNAYNQHNSESHLHFEIRSIPFAGGGFNGRIDPAFVLGWYPVFEDIFSR